MKITREWIESVSDNKGLNRGQQVMLERWATPPIVGATIPDHVARFIEQCRGYRPSGDMQQKDFYAAY